ncbi:hypothetical protein LTR37_000396 [Vermiconidia calcicola]|uniref:Uncharacterized protein n=1 Tax=Vermiconidia calcicola TaxID=1690605 RepID=A0ACC3NYQ6_9PEZI|nr:hypothetical protein LTR37_000396 [Vermiconidia calcicola]
MATPVTRTGAITTAEVTILTLSNGSPVTGLFTWSNPGPLTTTFTAPASCSTVPLGQLIAHSKELQNGGFIGGEYCGGIPPGVNCQPYGHEFTPRFGASQGSRYMSPGIYCPSGYSTADHLTLASANVSAVSLEYNTLRTTGTHVFCCPSGFSSSTALYWSALTTATSTNLCSQESTAAVTDSIGNTVSSRAAYDIFPFSWEPARKDTTVQMIVYPVYMIHQRSDVSDRSHTSRLSSGAIAGITVGCVAAIIIFLTLVYCLLKRRRRKDQKAAHETSEVNRSNEIDGVARAELHDKPVVQKYEMPIPTSELHDKPVLFEARDGQIYEMPIPTSELEGDTGFALNNNDATKPREDTRTG